MEKINNELSKKGKRDLKLLKDALNTGNPAAYSELLRLYRDPIYFMLYEKLNDQELAKDLTIESIGKAFKKLHLYTEKFAFSTWLYTIARNHTIDYLRKNKLPTVSIEKMLVGVDGKKTNFDIKSDDLQPDLFLEKKQRIAILRHVVENLKPKYRDLVKLRYFKEMSYEEISDELSMPLGTVKALLYRSREQLFKIISGRKEDL